MNDGNSEAREREELGYNTPVHPDIHALFVAFSVTQRALIQLLGIGNTIDVDVSGIDMINDDTGNLVEVVRITALTNDTCSVEVAK